MPQTTEDNWKCFKERGCQQARAWLITHYQLLCRITAHRLLRKPPANVEMDDVASEGLVGLVKAIDNFNPARKIRFRTYAITLIRGRILESFREGDWVPRLVREQAKQVEVAERAYEGRTGRRPNEAQLADAVGWSEETLHKLRMLIRQMALLSFEQTLSTRDPEGHPLLLADTIPDTAPSPAALVEAKERERALWIAVSHLPEREKRVTLAYYREGKTLKEISKLLSVSEGRVWQLHKQALRRMAGGFGRDWR